MSFSISASATDDGGFTAAVLGMLGIEPFIIGLIMCSFINLNSTSSLSKTPA